MNGVVKNDVTVNNYYTGPGKYYDENAAQEVVKVFSGEYHVSSAKNEVLVTILGSCIAVCIHDPGIGAGGMNHFLLPGDDYGVNADSTRYGVNAMELLLNSLIKMGGKRERMELKIFGGANVLDNLSAVDIGAKNIKFIRNFVAKESLKVVSEDVGGNTPRRVHFFPSTGKVMLKKINQVSQTNIAEKEVSYMNKIKQNDDVTLF